MAHHCHATNCERRTSPAIFMCRPHWFALPTPLRRQLVAAYRSGQEIDKRPSVEYCCIAIACVAWVASQENVIPDTRLYQLFLTEAK